MILAARYNQFTKSNITHEDVARWGLNTSLQIEMALELSAYLQEEKQSNL